MQVRYANAMGFRFSRRIRILPGIRINVGKRGVSTSFGTRGAWLTVGKRGTRVTVGLPGTGLSYTQRAQTRTDDPAPTANEPPGLASTSRSKWVYVVVLLGVFWVLVRVLS